MCKEVHLLRVEVAQYKLSRVGTPAETSSEGRCNALESQLDQANKTIHNYKRNEQKWNEEISRREKDFMNQINDLCSNIKAKEQYLMDEIIQRNKKIVEM